MSTYEKKDDNTLIVRETKAAEELAPVEYTYEYLLKQKADIINQANEYAAQRRVEIDKIDAMLAEANKLGVKLAVDNVVEI